VVSIGATCGQCDFFFFFVFFWWLPGDYPFDRQAPVGATVVIRQTSGKRVQMSADQFHSLSGQVAPGTSPSSHWLIFRSCHVAESCLRPAVSRLRRCGGSWVCVAVSAVGHDMTAPGGPGVGQVDGGVPRGTAPGRCAAGTPQISALDCACR